MDRALFTLMKLQARAAMRRTVRGIRSVRGAAFFAVGLIVFALWLGPTLLSLFLVRREAADPETVRRYVPAALLLACAASLMGTGDKALVFSPAEVNFLFPGPFTRRQLLGYKLVKAAVGAGAMGAFMSLALLRYAHFWLAALVGSFLSLFLVHLFTTCVVIVGQTVSATAYTRGRRVALAVVVAAAVLAVGPAVVAGGGGDLSTLVQRFADSTAGKVLLAPFQPFGRTFTATSAFPELLLWGAIAAGVNGALLALTLWLDANYLEAAAAASERVYERMQRVRSGGGAAAFGAGAAGNGGGERGAAGRLGAFASRLRVPRLPWLAGAGPVAWRQLTTVARRSGGLLFVLVLSAGVFVTFYFAHHRGANVQRAIFPGVGWFTLLLVVNLKFDFRGDLDQLPWLKSLPLRPWAVVVGQMAAPVLLLVACHLVIFLAAAAMLPALRATLLAAALLALPFDVVLLAVENLLFLLAPSRGPAVPGELGTMGRQVVLIVVKLLAVAVACGVAAGLAAVTMALTRSPAAALAVAFVVLTVEGMALLPLVALAYDRFDPSVDTPP